MIIDYEYFVDWEISKAVYLQQVALDLGMNLNGTGSIAVNKYSGYTYLYLEDYSFVLYLPIVCELIPGDVWVLYTDENGEEYEDTLDCIGTNVNSIENWVNAIDLEDAS